MRRDEERLNIFWKLRGWTYVWGGRGRDVIFGGRRGRREYGTRRRVDGRGDAVLGRLVGRIPGRETQRLRPQRKASAHVGKLVDGARRRAMAIDIAGRRAAITITTRRERGLSEAECVVSGANVLCVRLKWRDWTANAAAIQQLSCSTRSSSAAVVVGWRGSCARYSRGQQLCTAVAWQWSPAEVADVHWLAATRHCRVPECLLWWLIFLLRRSGKDEWNARFGSNEPLQALPHSFYIVSRETRQTIFRLEGNYFLDFYIPTASLYTIKYKVFTINLVFNFAIS